MLLEVQSFGSSTFLELGFGNDYIPEEQGGRLIVCNDAPFDEAIIDVSPIRRSRGEPPGEGTIPRGPAHGGRGVGVCHLQPIVSNPIDVGHW
jgi:hypothetical protein